METFIDLVKRPFIKRMLVLVIIAALLYFVRSQIKLLLLTFIFIYLVDSVQSHISGWLSKIIRTDKKAVIVFLYLIMAGLLFLFFYLYVPEIVKQVTDIMVYVTNFLLNIETQTNTDNIILNYIYDYLQKLDIQNYVKNNTLYIISLLGNVGSIGIKVIMAAMLSLFFLLQKEKIITFLSGFQNSKVDWIYDELKYFGSKFTNSFGKVVQTQILISFINSVISVIIFAFLRFPNTIGLFIMIFFLGMVPVVGAIISIIPLSIIAYSVGGINYVIYMLILILILHTLESYILNPKLMSNKTKLPVFVVFLILILSEHLMGIWGLIVGIPITIFILDVLEVKTDSE